MGTISEGPIVNFGEEIQPQSIIGILPNIDHMGCREQLASLHPPSIVALATMTVERGDIYRHFPSPGEPVPVGNPPFPFLLDYSMPEDEDIALAVRRLCLNRSGRPS